MRYCLVGSILLLCSCASQAIDEDKYLNALKNYYNHDNDLCLGELKWPILSSSKSEPWLIGRLNALANIGFVSASTNENGVLYTLTQDGRDHWQSHQDFCYGKLEVSHITDIEVHTDNTKTVYFYYGVNDLAPWAENSQIRHAFSELDSIIKGMNKELIQIDIREDENGNIDLINYPTPVKIDY